MDAANELSPLIRDVNKIQEAGLGYLSSVAHIISVFGVPPIVALPGALAYSVYNQVIQGIVVGLHFMMGYLGFPIIFMLIVLGTYTAVLLAKSWLLLEDNWSKTAALGARDPYSTLAFQVGGSGLSRMVKVIQNTAIFGESVPFLLLASENIHNVIQGIFDDKANFSFCYILIITLLVLIPISWLGSAKDLRHVTLIGAASVISISILVLNLLIFTRTTSYSSPTILPVSWKPVAYSFGAVAFQYGIHALVLTLQRDMKDKRQLPSVIIVAFAGSFILFGSIATVAFFLYGGSIQANLLNNFSNGPLLYVTQGVTAIQALICLCQGMNVLFQDLEETFGIPDMFGWRRVCLRSFFMLLVLFVAESIPHFAIAIELVGGLMMTPLIFIFPPCFYVVLKHKACGEINIMEVILGTTITVIGIIGFVASTTESGLQMSIMGKIIPPCYLDFRKASDPSKFQNSPIF